MIAPAPASAWNRKHLLGLEDLSREEILGILDTAESFSEVSRRSRKKVPALQGRVVFNLFFENSTRTRTSFGLAAKRLSADVQEFSASVSSLTKGETFIDTARNIEAMGADILVVRHPTPADPRPPGLRAARLRGRPPPRRDHPPLRRPERPPDPEGAPGARALPLARRVLPLLRDHPGEGRPGQARPADPRARPDQPGGRA